MPDDLDDATRAHFDQAHQRIDRLEALVDELLAEVKPQSGRRLTLVRDDECEGEDV
jgi:tetrahydromethanopterin S-methyltransferase subunit G